MYEPPRWKSSADHSRTAADCNDDKESTLRHKKRSTHCHLLHLRAERFTYTVRNLSGTTDLVTLIGIVYRTVVRTFHLYLLSQVSIVAMRTLFLFGLFTEVVLAVNPLVDVSYTRYQGTALHNGITQWLGIRYAAPPIKNLRFAAPQGPLENNTIQIANKASRSCLYVVRHR